MILFRIIPISNRFSRLLILSTLINLAHAGEVVISGYYHVSSLFTYLATLTHTQPIYTYLFTHLIIYSFLIITALKSRAGRLPFYSILIFGWILLSETHHAFTALRIQAYYPGTVTSILIIPLAIAFWIQCFKQARTSKK